jgi:hypothetical protein
MSWTLSVPKTAKADFPAAVDAAICGGQGDGGSVGVDEDVIVAKDLLKRFAERSESPFLTGNASGHALQPGQGEGWFNGLSVSVSSSEVP